jgi:hypothetical protein
MKIAKIKLRTRPISEYTETLTRIALVRSDFHVVALLPHSIFPTLRDLLTNWHLYKDELIEIERACETGSWLETIPTSDIEFITPLPYPTKMQPYVCEQLGLNIQNNYSGNSIITEITTSKLDISLFMLYHQIEDSALRIVAPLLLTKSEFNLLGSDNYLAKGTRFNPFGTPFEGSVKLSGAKSFRLLSESLVSHQII